MTSELSDADASDLPHGMIPAWLASVGWEGAGSHAYLSSHQATNQPTHGQPTARRYGPKTTFAVGMGALVAGNLVLLASTTQPWAVYASCLFLGMHWAVIQVGGCAGTRQLWVRDEAGAWGHGLRPWHEGLGPR